VANGLTAKQEAFVSAYIGEARGNASAAAKIAGYSVRQSAGDVLSNPVVQTTIQAWRDEIKASGIASLEYRIVSLDDMEQRYKRLIEARAVAYADDEKAIGGETGLVVGQLKKVTHVDETGDDGTKTWTEEQWEYVADTAVTKEIRAIYDDVAKELGQRVDKINVSGSLRREYVLVNPDDVTESAS
jgi:hypothetical protein